MDRMTLDKMIERLDTDFRYVKDEAEKFMAANNPQPKEDGAKAKAKAAGEEGEKDKQEITDITSLKQALGAYDTAVAKVAEEHQPKDDKAKDDKAKDDKAKGKDDDEDDDGKKVGKSAASPFGGGTLRR